MSLIAIDYDGTYTDDPKAWDTVIKVLQLAGHEVICVTMRYEAWSEAQQQRGEPIHNLRGVMIYYTARKAKKPWCLANGLNVDIWIDDQPAWILQDSE